MAEAPAESLDPREPTQGSELAAAQGIAPSLDGFSAQEQDAYRTPDSSVALVPIGRPVEVLPTTNLAAATQPAQQAIGEAPGPSPRPVPQASRGLTLSESMSSMLATDTGFAVAVASGNVVAAAAAAAQLIKQHLLQLGFKPPGVSPSAALSGHKRSLDDGAAMHGSDGAHTFRQQDLRTGDWVVVRSSSQVPDSDLVGQEGVISKVEHNGWADVSMLKLGRSIRVHTRMLMPAPSAGVPADLAQRAQGANDGWVMSRGYDGVHRPRPRPNQDPAFIRAAVPLDRLHPARVPPLMGRGVTKSREVVHLVRGQLLSLEESIGWHQVSNTWRHKRTAWRRGLRALDQARVADTQVAAVAAHMRELHEALLTDKTVGLFARSGGWSVRLAELADGGNNCMCLQQLWEEMQLGVLQWQGLQPAAQSGFIQEMDRGYASAYRAFSALDSAAEQGEQRISQVPLEHILCPQRDTYTSLKGLVDRERQHVTSRLHGSGGGGGNISTNSLEGAYSHSQRHQHQQGMLARSHSSYGQMGSQVAGVGRTVARERQGVVAVREELGTGRLLLSMGLRAELALVSGLHSELDTDVDEGPDATDMDVSD